MNPSPIRPVSDITDPDVEAFDEVWAALVYLFGEPATSSQRSYTAKVARELVDAGANGYEVIDRAKELVTEWGDPKYVTLGSLVKHWNRRGGVLGRLSADDVAGERYRRLLEGGDR